MPRLECHFAEAIADEESVLTDWEFMVQASLARVGVDASAAVARVRARSVSRQGRKRLRSASAAAPADMEVDGSQAPPKKRIHSSKSRSALHLLAHVLGIHCFGPFKTHGTPSFSCFPLLYSSIRQTLASHHS